MQRARPNPTYLGLEGPAVPDIPLQRLGTELGRNRGIPEPMHIDDMLSNVQIDRLVALIEHDKEQVESTHNRRTHGDVGSQAHLSVVPSADRVCSGQNRRSCVQRGLDTGLGDTDRLLFHGFVNGDLITDIHLVEFVNGADTVVCKHEGTSFNGEFAGFLVSDDSSGQTCGGRSLA